MPEATQPYPIPDATAQPFQLALHEVVRTSAVSLLDLRDRVHACVGCLKDSNIGPGQMIISMKACARESSERYPTVIDEHEQSNADFLMDQIISWSIMEYYRGS